MDSFDFHFAKLERRTREDRWMRKLVKCQKYLFLLFCSAKKKIQLKRKGKTTERSNVRKAEWALGSGVKQGRLEKRMQVYQAPGWVDRLIGNRVARLTSLISYGWWVVNVDKHLGCKPTCWPDCRHGRSLAGLKLSTRPEWRLVTHIPSLQWFVGNQF